MTDNQLPPGPARRAKLVAAGRNLSRRDFSDQEWAQMQAESAAAKRFRRENPGTPVSELQADAS